MKQVELWSSSRSPPAEKLCYLQGTSAKENKSSCGFVLFVVPTSLFHVEMKVPIALTLKLMPARIVN